MAAKLIFNYGVMSSSKTAQLLMFHHSLTEKGKKILSFKPKIDTRSGDYIESRALEYKVKAELVGSKQIFKMFDLASKKLPDVILLDEVNFLEEYHVDELRMIVDELNINVYCYGLLTDFQRTMFNGSKRLIELADVRNEITSECTICKNDANVNMRLNNGQPVFAGVQIQIGGNESYETVCHKCYSNLAKESKA